MARHLEIWRTSDNGKQTEGIFYVVENNSIIFSGKSLELPWKNNQRRISCIPTGKYKTIKHQSPKFKKSFWLQDVPGRSEILIHKGNYHFDVIGCILVGDSFVDLNKDGLMDVTNSVKTIDRLYELLPAKFETHIYYID